MENRLTLHNLLVDKLGSSNVYFQPPETIRMQYPCIVYSVQSTPKEFADDFQYKLHERYVVTFITRDPDAQLVNELWKTKGFLFDRHYAAENLHHFVYTYTFY